LVFFFPPLLPGARGADGGIGGVPVDFEAAADDAAPLSVLSSWKNENDFFVFPPLRPFPGARGAAGEMKTLSCEDVTRGEVLVFFNSLANTILGRFFAIADKRPIVPAR
jgi:hypothetical protein